MSADYWIELTPTEKTFRVGPPWRRRTEVLWEWALEKANRSCRDGAMQLASGEGMGRAQAESRARHQLDLCVKYDAHRATKVANTIRLDA